MFKKELTIMELRKDGTFMEDRFIGSRKQVKERIETLKKESRNYKIVNKKYIIVWA